MNADDLLPALADPRVIDALRAQLRLPDEPVADALRRVEESVARIAEQLERLGERVDQLTQAQVRTEQRVEELAQAQARTEQRVEELAKAQAELAQAQARTEQRVEELAQAQARTDEQLQKLAHRIEALTEAMEKGFAELRRDVNSLRREVGSLSQTVGSWVEDALVYAMPRWLTLHHSIEIEAEPEVGLLRSADGRELEFDAHVAGRGADGAPLVVLGEAKARAHPRDVSALARKRDLVAPELAHPVRAVLVAQWVHPDARRAGRDEGVLVATAREVMRDA